MKTTRILEVHDSDDSVHVAHLVYRTALAEGIAVLKREDRPVLHDDNGAPLKAATVLATLYCLGVKPSYARSRETRNWTPIGVLTLNPGRDSVAAVASAVEDMHPLDA